MSTDGGWRLAPVDVREAAPDPRPDPPGTVRVAVGLMVVGAALAVVEGVRGAAVLDGDDVRRDLDVAGISPGDVDGYVTTLRVAGVVLGLVAAGIWVLHALAARRGRSWVRPWATVLGAVFVLGGLTALGRAGSGPDVAYRLLRIAVAAGAVAALWLPASTAYLRALRPHRGG